MGEHYISAENDERQAQLFMKALLNDLAALERMLETGRIESGVRRIGAEQEMFLVDEGLRPTPIARVIARGEVLRFGTAGVAMQGTLRDTAGQVLAVATATAVPRPLCRTDSAAP